MPRQSPQGDRILLASRFFPFLAEKVAPDFATNRPVSGIQVLEALIICAGFVANFLREHRARVNDLLSAVVKMGDPHISTKKHRICASVRPIVHVLRTSPPAQIKTLLQEYEACKRAWTDNILPGIPSLP